MSTNDEAQYVNVSMGVCEFIEKVSKKSFELLWHQTLPENEILFLTKKILNTCIKSSYNVFCCKSKECKSPDFLQAQIVSM